MVATFFAYGLWDIAMRNLVLLGEWVSFGGTETTASSSFCVFSI